MLKAAILVPPDSRTDGHYAQSCKAYTVLQGYPNPTVTRSWNTAHKLLEAGKVQVVIVARGEHGTAPNARDEVADPGLTTVTILANFRGGRFGPERRRLGRWRFNRRAMPSATADQLIDGAVRRWRFGLRWRSHAEPNSRFPSSGNR